MKHSKSLLLAFLFFSTSIGAMASDGLTKENVSSKSETEVKKRVGQLLDRVEEIRGCDRTNMDQFERAELKEELIDIKKELNVAKTNGGTITISVGAAIIIILLLIIIL